MITLLGATGYTGRLVARALDRAGLSYRLAGRSPDKLARLAAALPAAPTWLVADVTRPETLPALFEGSRVLANCAGPFTNLGEPVVAQAALNGVHYLDTTNESGYVYRMQSYDALARRNGAALVPACAFEVALADCAAVLLAGGLAEGAPLAGGAPLDEVAVAYEIRGQGYSLGSRRSAVRALATSWLAYRDGQWVHAVPGRKGRRVPLPGGDRPALSFPSSEIVTVPGHLPVRRVTTWLAVSWHALFWAPFLVPAFAWLARGPVGRLVEAAITRLWPPPETGLRSDAPFAVWVAVRRGAEGRSLTMLGTGVYDLTGEIVAYAAGQMARPGYERAGVLAPAAALNPQALLDEATARWGLTVQTAEGVEW
jgi:short subunit dehydrogenase-like uncharacterized protein